jgi:hypothetical protein
VPDDEVADAKYDRHGEDAHGVDEIVDEQLMDKLGTALCHEVRTVLALQSLHFSYVPQEH